MYQVRSSLRYVSLLRGITAQTLAGVAGEEQVIVFAERVRCLRQLARTLRERHGVEAHVADGVVTRAEFEQLKQRFSAGEFPVLCLSQVGHEGHNLQTASVLVHLDLPWLQTGLEQRVGRAARPGARRGWVQTYIPYIKGGGIEHVVCVLAGRAAPSTTRSSTASKASSAAESTVATQLGQITSQVAAAKHDAGYAATAARLRVAASVFGACLTHARPRGPPDHSPKSRKETRMSAITAALTQIDEVAAEGDLAPDPGRAARARDGRASRSCCPTASASTRRCCTASRSTSSPARCSTWTTRPRSSFLRLIGPPGAGKSQIARAIAYRLWTGRGRDGRRPPRRAVLRLRRDAAGGPSSDEFFFRYDYVPSPAPAGRCPADRLGVRAGDARGLGGDDRRGQHRPRRRAAVDQRHPRRAARAVPAADRRDRRRPARLRGPARLQPGPRRRDRHPRRVALALPGDARGHEQLGGARAARRARGARREAARAGPPADRRRGRPALGRRSSATSSRCGG